MKSIFSDPIHWTAAAVGTKWRFALTLGLNSVVIGMALFEAADSGLSSAAGIAVFLVWMQFLLLFAMRALYLKGRGDCAGRKEGAAHSQESTGELL